MAHRIVILGAPGAGKSTLARQLAQWLGAPYYPLDPVAFVDERWTARPLPERQRLVAEIAALSEWITEGVHLDWTVPLLEAADLVIWLDPPWWTLLWRAAVRHVTRWVQGWPPQVDVRALVVEGWVFVGRYYWQHYRPGVDLDLGRNLSRAATAAALAPYTDKVVHTRSSRLSVHAAAPHLTASTHSEQSSPCQREKGRCP